MNTNQPLPFQFEEGSTALEENKPINEDKAYQKHENIYVHEVYDKIASHFSSTRYKPWPVIERFLLDLPIGSIGADVGCGNGKYMKVNSNLFLSGCDRSRNLIKICIDKDLEGIVADVLNLPYRNASCDFVISVAVIHHLTTSKRRMRAIQECLRILRNDGKLLIYVWATEQKGRRQFDPNVQDVLVPWVLNKRFMDNQTNSSIEKPTMDPSNKDKPDNNTIDINNSTKEGTSSNSNPSEIVMHRFYHLFQQGELESLIVEAGKIMDLKIEIEDNGYDKDNWWVVVKRLQ